MDMHTVPPSPRPREPVRDAPATPGEATARNGIWRASPKQHHGHHRSPSAVSARSQRHAGVVNLCFHGIGEPGRSLEPDEELYWIEPAQFDELLAVIRNDPRIRITFDDANASDALYAMPALLRHGLRGTFFVVAGRLDQPGSLSRADVRDLIRAGMSVGSHGLEHRPWRTVSDEDLEAELGQAAEIIGATVGRPIREVACPFGSYDRRVLRAIRRRGFDRVYTADGGAAARPNAWLQSRYTIRARDTPAVIERLRYAPNGRGIEPALQSVKGMIKRLR
jgi:peptidoglycan/xylan/chitin deacetylase (PgdA/CDA1 family)